MNSRPPPPLIGVPTQTLHAIDGISETLPPSWVMNQRYLSALASVGGVPCMVPLLEEESASLASLYERLDGVLLAGGVDIDPASYGRERHELCGRTDPARDRVEIQLTRWAMAQGKPVLGVCRGVQVINVAAGGSLHQDSAACCNGSIKHDYFPTQGYARERLSHEVILEPGSRLEQLFAAQRIRVNSMHHQVVDALGSGLVVTARAPDGLIEGVEGTGESFLIGVQWHPEVLLASDAGTRRLFEAFVQAAEEYAARSQR